MSGGGINIGGLTDAVGLTDYAGARRAEDRASDAAEAAAGVARSSSRFARRQYEDWQDIYGDVQENLAEYYETLSPESITSLGLQEQSKATQLAREEIKQSFASRGLAGSGFETSTMTDLALDDARSRARIRVAAPDMVRGQKENFLRIGLGQKPALMSGVLQSGANLANVYQGQAMQAYNAATQTRLANMQGMQDIVGTGAGAATSLATGGVV